MMEVVAAETILASSLGFVNLGELFNPSGLFLDNEIEIKCIKCDSVISWVRS